MRRSHRALASRVLWCVPLIAALCSGCDDSEPVTAQTVLLSLAPATMSFGAVPVGAQAVRSLVVLNSGNAAWVPDGPPRVTGTGFSWRTGCDVPLAPGDACTLEVAFTPRLEGDAVGAVSIATTTGEPVINESALSGTATPATITFTPGAIDFGELQAGEVATADVLVTNTGGEAITTTATMIGDGAFFVGSASTRSVPLVLGSGARATISLAFRPTQSGARTATLVAEVCGAGCGPGLPLEGIATAPQIDAAPRQVDFGAVEIGDVATTTVHVSNAGTGQLNVTDVGLVGAIGAELTVTLPTLPALLGPGEGVDVEIAFSPLQGRAPFTTQLSIASSDARSPLVVVPISASVTGPGLQVVPGALHFGRLADAASRDSTVVVRSIGTAAVDVEALRTTGDAFAIVNKPPLPQRLAPGEALQFVVRATATADAVRDGGAQAELVVEGAGVADVVADLALLAGSSGCAPMVLVSHAQLGTVQQGAGTTGSVAIQNVGDTTCVLESFVPGGSGFAFDRQFQALPVGLDELGPGEIGEVAFGINATREGTPTAMVELRFVDVPAPLFVSASATVVFTSVVVAPAVLAFGPRQAACGDEVQTASLINDGGTNVTIASVTVSDPIFTVALAPLPLLLSPGSSAAVTVTARPSLATPGVHTARATFATSDGTRVDLDLALEVVSSAVAAEETFSAPPSVSAVDILFVVDNSGSMLDDQQQLADNFAAFFADALASGEHDFQVGVTTTDVVSVGAASGSLVGDVPILTPSTFALAEQFAANVLVGIEGSGLELGLEAMRLALNPTRNIGFIRSNAALSVVFVSDEEDNGGDLQIVPPELARAPAEYAALLRSLKAGNLTNTPILVSGVLAPGSARYEAVIDEFRGSTIDIGLADWGTRLARFGVDTFALARTFVLASTADETSITVTIDGAVTTAWTWDPVRNAVILDENAPSGSDVVITYLGSC